MRPHLRDSALVRDDVADGFLSNEPHAAIRRGTHPSGTSTRRNRPSALRRGRPPSTRIIRWLRLPRPCSATSTLPAGSGMLERLPEGARMAVRGRPYRCDRPHRPLSGSGHCGDGALGYFSRSLTPALLGRVGEISVTIETLTHHAMTITRA